MKCDGGATRSHVALALRAYAARFVAESLVEQQLNHHWLSHFIACLLTGCVVNVCTQARFAARPAPLGSESNSLLAACC